MALFHFKVKSHSKGKAADRSKYIARQGKYHSREEELVYTTFGNMPDEINGNPFLFWREADENERANGSACREFEMALPNELSTAEHVEMIKEFNKTRFPGQPFQIAIHAPIGSLSGIINHHAHNLVSDRKPDGINRPLKQTFKRYNAAHPENGGCKKVSGGKTRKEISAELSQTRETWADIQNQALERAGHDVRVDHRSLHDQGIDRAPERHLGAGKIRTMSANDKNIFLETRKNKNEKSSQRQQSLPH